jgi:hypothetical protein
MRRIAPAAAVRPDQFAIWQNGGCRGTVQRRAVHLGAMNMDGVTSVDFDHPDETRTFPHGRADIVRVGPSTIARLTLEPGWHWAQDVKPIAGTDTCQVRHVGYMVSGRLKATMADGTELEIGPGEAYVIEPGHDAVVLGDNQVIGVEFSTPAAETFAKAAS